MNDMTMLEQKDLAEIELGLEEKNAAPAAIVRAPAVEKERKRYFYPFAKRAFDLICSVLAIIILSPLFLVVAILIKHEDKGPVIHRRQCVGKKGTYFMLKFRTMVPDANNLEKYLTPEQIEEYKKSIKLENDPRMTKTGRFLRRLSLDELPQFVNILRNETSFVGPRSILV